MIDPVYPSYPSNKILLTKKDIETISQIIRDNQLTDFEISQDSTSGIGRITNIEFDYELNGRYATVRMNINDQSEW